MPRSPWSYCCRASRCTTTTPLLSFFKQIVGLFLEIISRSWQTPEYLHSLQSSVSLVALFLPCLVTPASQRTTLWIFSARRCSVAHAKDQAISAQPNSSVVRGRTTTLGVNKFPSPPPSFAVSCGTSQVFDERHIASHVPCTKIWKARVSEPTWQQDVKNHKHHLSISMVRCCLSSGGGNYSTIATISLRVRCGIVSRARYNNALSVSQRSSAWTAEVCMRSYKYLDGISFFFFFFGRLKL